MKRFAAVVVIVLTTPLWAKITVTPGVGVECSGGCSTEVSGDGSEARMCDSEGNCVIIKLAKTAEPNKGSNPDTSPK